MNNRDDLPARSDALLAEVPRPKDSPFVNERYLQRKALRDRFIDPRVVAPPDPAAPLTFSEIRAVIRSCPLTGYQRHIVNAVLEGETEVAISEGRVTRQAISKTFRQAIKKIRAHWHVYPYSGLADVYRSEIRRKGRDYPVRPR